MENSPFWKWVENNDGLEPNANLSEPLFESVAEDRRVTLEKLSTTNFAKHFSHIESQVFHLLIKENKSIRETSKQLGIPKSSVHYIKGKIIRKVREIIL